MLESTSILVAYYSATGAVEAMARSVADGAASVEGTNVVLRSVDAVTREDLLAADGIVLGTPVYFGNMAAPVKEFIDDWGFQDGTFLEDRAGGAFAVGEVDNGGREHAVLSLLVAMLSNGMVVVGPTHQVDNVRYGGFGAATLRRMGIGSRDGDSKERELGRRVATLARSLARARRETPA